MTTPNPTITAPLTPQREAEIRERAAAEKPGHSAMRDLLAELDRTRAEYEPYEMLTEQGCQAGKHPTWLVDSPDHHACPWCQIDELKKRVTGLDRQLSETIDDRDRATDAADKLAYAIAPIEDIGEHSSENSPWENALGIVTPAVRVDELKEQLLTAQGDVAHEALRADKAENERDKLKGRLETARQSVRVQELTRQKRDAQILILGEQLKKRGVTNAEISEWIESVS